MKTSFLNNHRHRGGIMAIALVAIGFITIGFTAWVGLLGQRGRAGEVEEHAAKRRLAAWNTRSAIREYALERAITSSGDNDGVAFDPWNGWTVTSAGSWSGYAMDSSTRLAGLNAFSFSWDYPYSKVLDTTAGTKALGYVQTGTTGRVDASYTATASYFKTYLRSRSPVLGGDLLIVHRPTISGVTPAVSGNVSVNGRVLHFVPELAATAYTARSLRFLAPPTSSGMTIQPRDLNGNSIPPSNMAWTPVTFGRVGGVTDMTGQLNVIDDANNGGNSLRAKLAASAATIQNPGGTALTDPRGYVNNGSGQVTVTPCTGDPADLPSLIIDSEVTEMIIEGQTGSIFDSYAQYRPAIAIVYVQRADAVRKLQTIRLRKQDRRRFVLALKQEGTTAGQAVNVIVEDTNTSSEWNMMILAENMPLNFSANPPVSSIRINGGIQTNAPLAGPGNGQTLSLQLQSDTRGLIKLAPRAAWVETVMPDKVPNSTADNSW